MTLDSRSLTVGQLCARRWKIETTEPRGRWHPKTLFDAVLRGAILDLSNGVPKETVTLQAQTKFRAIAKSPGLDTLSDPWTLAGDYCACLATIVEALSRLTLLSLQTGQVVKLDEGTPEIPPVDVDFEHSYGGSPAREALHWRVSAFQDDSGALHRWATAERFDEDTLASELHSWHVYGDMAAAVVPLTLHLVEIGSLRAGRRHSPWCKIFRHPVVAGHFRFRAKTGEKLKGGWKPVWYGPDQDPEKWVDLMESDHLTLIHHIECKPLSPEAIQGFKWQVVAEARRLAALGDWPQIPMWRPACDHPYVCPHQNLCYQS